MVGAIIVGVLLLGFGVACMGAALQWNEPLAATVAVFPIILGIVFMFASSEIISEQNELLRTPAIIEQMKQEAKTPEEKEIVNGKITEYNNDIATYHKDLLTQPDRSPKEQEIFELQPIEPMQ